MDSFQRAIRRHGDSVQLRHGIRFQQRKAMNLIIEIFMTWLNIEWTGSILNFLKITIVHGEPPTFQSGDLLQASQSTEGDAAACKKTHKDAAVSSCIIAVWLASHSR